ncbi:MAG: hypothetical protein AAGA18_15660, partial [Verrucomicrobiota bacterium]
MTQIQLEAICCRLKRPVLIKECKSLIKSKKFKLSSTSKIDEIKKWLLNGWNTEHLLHVNLDYLDGDALRNSLQWGFAQAYYSVFAITLSYFEAFGKGQKSHKAVMKEFSTMIDAGRYPISIGFLAKGGKTIDYKNIDKKARYSSVDFNSLDSESIDSQIASFLKATSERELQKQLKDMKLKTDDNKPRQKFNKKHYDNASKKIGYTSILNLLYRNRIKANYSDIDTYFSDQLDVRKMCLWLKQIVGSCNIVHEFMLN